MEVTLLDASERRIAGFVADVSANGIRLLLPERVLAGTPVKIEAADTLLLGDVCYCQRDDAAFRVGISVKHRVALNRTPTEAASSRR